MEDIKDRAYDLGYGVGKSVGSWVIDGNTTVETAQAIIKGWNDGDPAVMDMQPAALSGEFADSPTPASIAADLDIDEADDDVCSAFEDGFDSGYWDQVIASATKVVE